MWELRTTHPLLKMRGVLGWWRWEGGGYWHLRRTFPLQWKQSNQLQHSKEFTSHPPCPTSPPPPPPLHYHIKAPSSEQVFSFKNGSEAESGRGRGQDRGSRSRPKTEFAFIPLWCASICARETECVYGCASSSLCLLARKHCRKSVEILKDYWLSLSQAAMKRSQFTFQRQTMGPTGGLSSSEMPKQVHSAVRRALCDRWPAEYRQSHRSLYLFAAIFTSSINLLLTYTYSLVCFSAQLTVQVLTDPLCSLLGD